MYSFYADMYGKIMLMHDKKPVSLLTEINGYQHVRKFVLDNEKKNDTKKKFFNLSLGKILFYSFFVMLFIIIYIAIYKPR